MEYTIEQIKEHIDNAHCDAHYAQAEQLYVIGQALTALAMMEFNKHLVSSHPLFVRIAKDEEL